LSKDAIAKPSVAPKPSVAAQNWRARLLAKLRNEKPLWERVWVVVLFVGAVGSAVILLEHLVSGLRTHADEHAFLVEIASGVFLVGPLFLKVERALTGAREEAWRQPAMDAVRDYVAGADRFTTQLTDLLTGEKRWFSPSAGIAEYAGAYSELVEQKPRKDDFFDRLNRLASDQALHLNAVAERATTTLGHYPRLSTTASRISRTQYLTDELARVCNDIHQARSTSEGNRVPPCDVRQLAKLTVDLREPIQDIQADLKTEADPVVL
jgi:hypothetical protein